MVIKKYTIYNIPKYIYTQCKKLNLGIDNGHMYGYLESCNLFKSKGDFKCYIWVLLKDKEVITWSIAQNLIYRKDDLLEISIFTPLKYRKNGYAKQLLTHILKSSKFKYSCWTNKNQNSYKLFYKLKCDNLILYDSIKYGLKCEYHEIK